VCGRRAECRRNGRQAARSPVGSGQCWGSSRSGFAAVPVDGPSTRLPGIVGRGRAFEILLGGEDFDGGLAERYGYVNRAVPDAEFVEFVCLRGAGLIVSSPQRAAIFGALLSRRVRRSKRGCAPAPAFFLRGCQANKYFRPIILRGHQFPNKMSELVLFGRTDLAVLDWAIPLCVGATSTQRSNPAKKIGGEASVRGLKRSAFDVCDRRNDFRWSTNRCRTSAAR
jgi:hypothetical protein